MESTTKSSAAGNARDPTLMSAANAATFERADVIVRGAVQPSVVCVPYADGASDADAGEARRILAEILGEDVHILPASDAEKTVSSGDADSMTSSSYESWREPTASACPHNAAITRADDMIAPLLADTELGDDGLTMSLSAITVASLLPMRALRRLTSTAPWLSAGLVPANPSCASRTESEEIHRIRMDWVAHLPNPHLAIGSDLVQIENEDQRSEHASKLPKSALIILNTINDMEKSRARMRLVRVARGGSLLVFIRGYA